MYYSFYDETQEYRNNAVKYSLNELHLALFNKETNTVSRILTSCSEEEIKEMMCRTNRFDVVFCHNYEEQIFELIPRLIHSSTTSRSLLIHPLTNI